MIDLLAAGVMYYFGTKDERERQAEQKATSNTPKAVPLPTLVRLDVWADRGDGTQTAVHCVATTAMQAAEHLTRRWTIVDGTYTATNGQRVTFSDNTIVK